MISDDVEERNTSSTMEVVSLEEGARQSKNDNDTDTDIDIDTVATDGSTSDTEESKQQKYYWATIATTTTTTTAAPRSNKKKCGCTAACILLVLLPAAILLPIFFLGGGGGGGPFRGWTCGVFFRPYIVDYNYTLVESPILDIVSEQGVQFADVEGTALNDGITDQLESVLAWNRSSNNNLDMNNNTHRIVLQLKQGRDSLYEIQVHGIVNQEVSLSAPQSIRLQWISSSVEGTVISNNVIGKDLQEEEEGHWVEYFSLRMAEEAFVPSSMNMTTHDGTSTGTSTGVITQLWLDVTCAPDSSSTTTTSSKCGITEVEIFAF